MIMQYLQASRFHFSGFSVSRQYNHSATAQILFHHFSQKDWKYQGFFDAGITIKP